MASFDDLQNVFASIFISLLVGAVVTYFLSRFAPKIPYTVVVVFMIALTFPLLLTDRKEGQNLSLGIWNQMPSNLILFVFLPTLLFGEAMSLNFHYVQEVLPLALLLAIPGATFGMFLVASLLKLCFPYNWCWHLSFLFGAIVSATDPVGKLSLAILLNATLLTTSFSFPSCSSINEEQ